MPHTALAAQIHCARQATPSLHPALRHLHVGAYRPILLFPALCRVLDLFPCALFGGWEKVQGRGSRGGEEVDGVDSQRSERDAGMRSMGCQGGHHRCSPEYGHPARTGRSIRFAVVH